MVWELFLKILDFFLFLSGLSQAGAGEPGGRMPLPPCGNSRKLSLALAQLGDNFLILDSEWGHMFLFTSALLESTH